MEPATAALIGAGVASVVSLLAQYLAHFLSLRRDRRNQRRQRLSDIIDAAGAALYEPRRLVPTTGEEPDYPSSLAGRLARKLNNPNRTAFSESWGDGLVLLQVHFGHDHPLIDSYVEAYTVIARAHEAIADRSTHSLEDFPEILHAAQHARDGWMRRARTYVDAI